MIILAVLAALLVFLGLLRVSMRRRKNAVCIQLCMQVTEGSSTFIIQGSSMKKISSAVSHFVISIVALTAAGVSAAVDGAISVVSSNPDVLRVTPQADGTYMVEVVGVGPATLTASGDADLGDGVRTISDAFEFEVYDGATEADHFDLSISAVTHAAVAVDGADNSGDAATESAETS